MPVGGLRCLDGSGDAGDRLSVGLVRVQDGLIDRLRVGDVQGFELHPAVRAGHAEPQPLVGKLQLHDFLTGFRRRKAQERERVETADLAQLRRGGDGPDDGGVHVDSSFRLLIRKFLFP